MIRVAIRFFVSNYKGKRMCTFLYVAMSWSVCMLTLFGVGVSVCIRDTGERQIKLRAVKTSLSKCCLPTMTMLVISDSKIISELWSRDIYPCITLIIFTIGTFSFPSLFTEPPFQLLTQTQSFPAMLNTLQSSDPLHEHLPFHCLMCVVPIF